MNNQTIILSIACIFLGSAVSALTIRALYFRRILRIYNSSRLAFPDLEAPSKMSIRAILEYLEHVLQYSEDYFKNDYQDNLLKKEAELYVLQGQINPHFLYNTLDSIRGQALIDGSTEIAETLEALSSLFRYSISSKENITTLKQELNNLNSYSKIQKYRYPDRIDIKVDIDEPSHQLMSCIIPKLTLQPLIENAIQHGLEEKLGKGTITVRIFRTQAHLMIIVEDDGAGMDDEQLLLLKTHLAKGEPRKSGVKITTGIALVNVNQRIKYLFGKEYGMEIYSTKGLGTSVELSLPIIHMEERTHA